MSRKIPPKQIGNTLSSNELTAENDEIETKTEDLASAETDAQPETTASTDEQASSEEVKAEASSEASEPDATAQAEEATSEDDGAPVETASVEASTEETVVEDAASAESEEPASEEEQPEAESAEPVTFADLGLSKKVLKAVTESGYTEPTPIQAASIPPALERRDVLGVAQTGTGKTASFTLPMLTLLEKGRARARMPRTLILTPTRELAAQIEENFNKYGKGHRLTVALLIGGVSFEEQFKKLDRGADVLIATPGRLLDHFERGKLLLTGVEIFVIDEADRMLDMGFIPDIERIAKLIPFTRQTLFFSATMPPEIEKLADQFLSNPARVEIARQSTTATTVKQHLVKAVGEPWDKRAKLRELINEAEELNNAIIFCNRKRDVSELYRSLDKHGFVVGALHGDMDQRSRTTILENFRAGNLPLLVASDVAARGLDIPDVSHVFNFDVPVHAEDYVHRIGRTGRAGRKGVAFTLVTGDDEKLLGNVLELTGQAIEWLGGEEVDFSEEAPRKRGRKRGPSKRGPKERAETPAPQEVKSEQSQGEEKKRGRGRGRRRDRDDDDNVTFIGFGSHVPEFVLRPVKIGATAKAS